jgi:chromosome partitioning protein
MARTKGDRRGAYVLAAMISKGGDGKTTVNTHLAEGLVDAGYRVLLVDDEGQQSATTMYGIQANGDLTLYDVLATQGTKDAIGIEDVIMTLGNSGMDIVPSHRSLWELDYNRLGDRALREAIEAVRNDYDFIIVDPPPALGPAAKMAIRAADGILVVVAPGPLDSQGLARFWDELGDAAQQTRKERAPSPAILGILFNKYRGYRLLDSDLRQELINKHYPVLPLTIRESTLVGQAQCYCKKGRSVLRYRASSEVAEDFRILISYVERVAGYGA